MDLLYQIDPSRSLSTLSRLAAGQGLEPQLTAPEAAVLPLDEPAIHKPRTRLVSSRYLKTGRNSRRRAKQKTAQQSGSPLRGYDYSLIGSSLSQHPHSAHVVRRKTECVSSSSIRSGVPGVCFLGTAHDCAAVFVSDMAGFSLSRLEHIEAALTCQMKAVVPYEHD